MDASDVLSKNKGICLYRIKRFDQALASFDQAIKLDPNDVSALDNKGRCLFDLKRFYDAINSYDQAIPIIQHMQKYTIVMVRVLKN